MVDTNINLGGTESLGLNPTDAEAAIIKDNLNIDITINVDPREGVGLDAYINTTAVWDDLSSPTVNQYFKKVGPLDTDWIRLMSEDEIILYVQNNTAAIQLYVTDPSLAPGIEARVGTIGLDSASPVPLLWYKYGEDDTDWSESGQIPQAVLDALDVILNADYVTQAELDLKADQTSISNIDNTSDLSKSTSGPISDALDLKSDKLTSAITSNFDIGGISNGEELPIGTDLEALITALITSIFFPTYVAPSVNLTTSGADTREIGSTDAITLTATFDAGDILGDLDGGIWNPALSQNDRAGTTTLNQFSGTGISVSQAGAALTLTAGTYPVKSGSNSFYVNTTHATGVQPLDSSGADYQTPLSAGAVDDFDTTINGIHPFFHLRSASPITAAAMVTAIEDGSATKVLSSSTGTINVPYNVSGEYLAVAYPATSTDKTVYYVTALDTGDITLLFDPLTTLPVDSFDTYWSAVNFDIHVSSTPLTNGNATIQLRNN